MYPVGATTWVVSAAVIPAHPHREPGRVPRPPENTSDRVCVLNTAAEDVDVEIVLFFDGRPPSGPHRITVPAETMHYVDFARLTQPALPHGLDFSAVLTAGAPVVVQHVRRELAGDRLLTTTSPAYAVAATA